MIKDWIVKDYEFLRHSPIVEGNLFIQFDQEINDDLIKSVAEIIKSPNSRIEDLITLTFKGKINVENSQSKSELNTIGLRITDENNNNTVHIRKGDLLISHKKPYSGWEDLYNHFLNILEAINSQNKSIQISRLGCRFINIIDVDLSRVVNNKFSLGDYFNVFPHFKDGYIDNIQGFNFQFNSFKDNMDSLVKFNTNVVKHNLNIVFDIEVFEVSKIETTDFKRLNKTFFNIREYKNYIFHNSITETVKNQFK